MNKFRAWLKRNYPHGIFVSYAGRMTSMHDLNVRYTFPEEVKAPYRSSRGIGKARTKEEN